MTQPKLMPKPFAVNGAKSDVPVDRSGSDALEIADYDKGFPTITMTPIAAGGKAPRGTDFNGVLHDITANISHQNKGGKYQFDTDFAEAVGGYPKGSVLMNDALDTEYVSLLDNNEVNFNTATGTVLSNSWGLYGGKKLIDLVKGSDHKNSVLCVITDPAVPLSGLPASAQCDGVPTGAIVAGERVLRATPSASVNNGIWILSTSAWIRATDADEAIEVSAEMRVPVEQGNLYAGSTWSLATDNVIFGTTPLLFNVTQKFEFGDWSTISAPIAAGTAHTLESPPVSIPRGVYLVQPYSNLTAVNNFGGSYYIRWSGRLVSGSGFFDGTNTAQPPNSQPYSQPPFLMKITSASATVVFFVTNAGGADSPAATVTNPSASTSVTCMRI
jgi:hypothetical protein